MNGVPSERALKIKPKTSVKKQLFLVEASLERGIHSIFFNLLIRSEFRHMWKPPDGSMYFTYQYRLERTDSSLRVCLFAVQVEMACTLSNFASLNQ